LRDFRAPKKGKNKFSVISVTLKRGKEVVDIQVENAGWWQMGGRLIFSINFFHEEP
jgi:hypothetical protein